MVSSAILLIADMEPDEVLGAVEQHLCASPQSAETRHRTYFDTFDWRLYRKEISLCYVNGPEGTLLFSSMAK